jgi:hypothetical protein
VGRIESQKEDLLPDVFEWIFHSNQFAAFTNWTEPALPLRRLMWINGPAGTGKTMLLIGIIRNLSAQSAVLAPSLSYFFCQGTGTKKLNSATVALRSLIWMLLIQQPDLISHVQPSHETSGSALFNDGNEFFALKRIFQNMLKDPALFPVYLIIDALDECDRTNPGLEELIKVIAESFTLSERVKWLLSSRPDVNVLTKLKELGRDVGDGSDTLVKLDTERLTDPVNTYIDHKLANFKGKDGYNDDVLDKLSNEIRQRAENTFLWVWLAFKSLGTGDETVVGEYALEFIKDIPLGLQELYDHMMMRIEKIRKVKPQDCKEVLVASILAYRPLSLSELQTLAGLSVGVTKTAVEMCGSFLTMRGSTVNIIHQSAKDYLKENYKSRLHEAGTAQGHVNISNRSILKISSILERKNIYSLSFGFKPEDMRTPEPDPLAPIRYSCVFWAAHLCDVNGGRPRCEEELRDDGRVFDFLKQRFLRWLESLSLLGELSAGAQSMRKLLRVVQVGYNSHGQYKY